MRQILKVDRFTSSNAMLKSLNLMSIKQLIIFRTVIFIFNIIHGLAPQYITNRIIYNVNATKQLRNQNSILLTRANTACSQNASFYKCIKLYHCIIDLPNEIKSEVSKSEFQKLHKEHIFETM